MQTDKFAKSLKENEGYKKLIEDKVIDFRRISKIAQRNAVEFMKPLFFNYLMTLV
jgi:hypothetical protein